MKRICFVNLLLCFVIAQTIDAVAAPHPGMGSSRLAQLRLPLRVGNAGFMIQVPETWVGLGHFDPKLKSIEYFSNQRPSAQLNIRWEILKSPPTMESYAKKWMKDYNNYGFEILGTKSFGEKNNRGLVVDLRHGQFKKTQRQVIYLNGKNVVVLSCTDNHTEFDETLKTCNEAFRGFTWVQQNTSKR